MKVLNIIIAIGVLLIMAACGLILYAMFEYYRFATRTDFGGYGPTITNEFYILVISTFVLAIFSIPVIIYQIKKIVNTPENSNSDELIDSDEVAIAVKKSPRKLLYNSTKFYAFALLTQLILTGNKLMDSLGRMDDTYKWLFLAGFVSSAIIALYFLVGNKDK